MYIRYIFINLQLIVRTKANSTDVKGTINTAEDHYISHKQRHMVNYQIDCLFAPALPDFVSGVTSKSDYIYNQIVYKKASRAGL